VNSKNKQQTNYNMTTLDALEALRTGEGWDMQLESIYKKAIEAVEKRRAFIKLIDEISKKQIIQISCAYMSSGVHCKLERSWNEMFSSRQFIRGTNASDITEIILIESNPDKTYESYIMKYGGGEACFVTVKK